MSNWLERGAFLNNDEFRELGHKLINLHGRVRAIIATRKIKLPNWCDIDDLDERLLNFLNSFASSKGRYYNLEALESNSSQTDPLAEWTTLLEEIYGRDLSAQVRRSAETAQSRLLQSLEDHVIGVPEFDTAGELGNWQERSRRANRLRETAVPVQYRIMKLLVPIRELFWNLSSELREKQVSTQDIPEMSEFLEFLIDNAEDLKSDPDWLSPWIDAVRRDA